MKYEIFDETLTKDRYRIIKLTNGEHIIGVMSETTSQGITLKNPVGTTHKENEVFFTFLFNGMATNRTFFFSFHHILTAGLLDEDIKGYYEKYIQETLEEMENKPLNDFVEKEEEDRPTIH